MPWKSANQRAKCYVLKAKGKNGSWNCAEWSKHTTQKSLPKRISRKK